MSPNCVLFDHGSVHAIDIINKIYQVYQPVSFVEQICYAINPGSKFVFRNNFTCLNLAYTDTIKADYIKLGTEIKEPHIVDFVPRRKEI